jgi:hypothetical protein
MAENIEAAWLVMTGPGRQRIDQPIRPDSIPLMQNTRRRALQLVSFSCFASTLSAYALHAPPGFDNGQRVNGIKIQDMPCRYAPTPGRQRPCDTHGSFGWLYRCFVTEPEQGTLVKGQHIPHALLQVTCTSSSTHSQFLILSFRAGVITSYNKG